MQKQPLDSTGALNRFLTDIERRAFSMANFSAHNTEDALDIVQDAMFDFVRHYAARPEVEWKPLFFKVLNSRIRDWQRRNAIRSRFRAWFGFFGEDTDEPIDPIDSIADTSTPDPAAQLVWNNVADALKTGLRSLPLRQRQAFLLRVWEGLDVAGTAQAMGCSEGSVKTHYSRAVHALQVLLEEYRP
jgi:RNA polymerase sigma-70 factor (ECF subfamily)